MRRLGRGFRFAACGFQLRRRKASADAADVRDDLIDRTVEGDPSLRSSVTEGVVGQGVPQADPDTPDPQRETGIDTDKPAR